MKAKLSSAPVFIQVLGFGIITAMAAHLISFLLLFAVPPAADRSFTVADAAETLRSGSPVRHQGRALELRRSDAIPPTWRQDLGPMELRLRDELAAILGVDRRRVQVKTQVQFPGRNWILRPRDTGKRGWPTSSYSSVQDQRIAARAGALSSPMANFPFDDFAAGLQRSDGSWLIVQAPRPFLEPWQQGILIWLAASVLLLAPLAYFFARRLVRPILMLSESAQRIGYAPLPLNTVEGPPEVRTAARALQQMQTRIRRYVDERTGIVAAIAHDMRTPLMRLRFRIESLEYEDRRKAAADIEEMQAMISAALGFAKAETQTLDQTVLDLGELVEAVVDDWVETGANVSLDGCEPLPISGDALALRRVLSNLLDNAISYGRGASCRAFRRGGWAVVQIDDQGGGLPEAELERVFEPFYRTDPARGRRSGGAGLGLAVSRSLARAQGGDVTLLNLEGGGLRAELQLSLVSQKHPLDLRSAAGAAATPSVLPRNGRAPAVVRQRVSESASWPATRENSALGPKQT